MHGMRLAFQSIIYCIKINVIHAYIKATAFCLLSSRINSTCHTEGVATEGVATEGVATEGVTMVVTTTITTEVFTITTAPTMGGGGEAGDMVDGIGVGDLGSDVPFSLFS